MLVCKLKFINFLSSSKFTKYIYLIMFPSHLSSESGYFHFIISVVMLQNKCYCVHFIRLLITILLFNKNLLRLTLVTHSENFSRKEPFVSCQLKYFKNYPFVNYPYFHIWFYLSWYNSKWNEYYSYNICQTWDSIHIFNMPFF